MTPPAPAPASAVVAALASAGRHNAYFLVETADDGADDWRPVTGLFGAGLDDLLAAVADRLGHDEPRVAASIAFQGYAAKIWSPVLAAVTESGVLPDLAPEALRWRYRAGEPVGLLLGPATGWQTTDPADVYAVAVERHLGPLLAAVRARVSVSERLLWGNVAAALAGAGRVLGPGSAPLRSVLLGLGRLSGTVDEGTGLRRTCCLFYRIPGGGTCGDCVLRGPRTGRR
ncbi:(2Fe-2S)-binding protein [Longispora sp. NPDC051575]|uniref:(2Fe-2S)-binding protein n=1 Tax=Longispora sp. NPDC051575 TaxID=3154943 RepID=UPI00343EE3F3